MGEHVDAIKASQRPFVDDRSEEEKQNYLDFLKRQDLLKRAKRCKGWGAGLGITIFAGGVVGGILGGVADWTTGATIGYCCGIGVLSIIPYAILGNKGSRLEAEAYKIKGPVYVRLSRLATPIIYEESQKFELGKMIQIGEGTDATIFATGDVVVYTLRIYNEGSIAGYADEVKDDVPEGLEFIPNNSINEEYRWEMYDAEGNITENVDDAASIRTDYLSKEQADITGRDNLIEAFDPDTMTQPDYKDLKIAFRVIEPNTSDRVLINTAEISEDSDEEGKPIDDIDSTPDNDVDEEDDIDIEKVKVSYFDLALKKIITKVTMTLDGETTVEETGHTFEDNPEEIVKVELGNHKINDSVLKFTYQIRITNEGNKPGYAYEIKDYIPEGLEFVEEDNEGWTLSEDGKTVTTDLLADTLLEPGDSATVEITLRWINGHNNLGVKTNWAEISEDSDDDIDSTPDNFEKGEDDIDDAEVVLAIVTGVGENYIGLIAVVLVILAGGVVLIKKFVL